VTERNLDWMTAVLAIFKAGGAYLPIEPHFPADRIARHFPGPVVGSCSRADSTGMLYQAVESLSVVQTLFIELAYEGGYPEGNLGIDVVPGQLAYIYFTSGSTGEPKGAMCEHAGMLNHLFAKIDDLRIGEGDVVAQTRRSASTSRCGNWFPRCWSEGGRCSSSRRQSWTRSASSTRSSTLTSTSFKSCRLTLKFSCPIWSSTPARCWTCGACRPRARR